MQSPLNNFTSFWKIPPAGKDGTPYYLEHPGRGTKPQLVRFGPSTHLYVTLPEGDDVNPAPTGTIPFNPDEAVENLLFERYRTVKESKNLCLALYYRAKPHLPRRAQLAFRRLYSYRQRRKRFPTWPFDPSLYELYRFLLSCEMKIREEHELPYIGFWPEGKRFCFVMTHDVETAEGFRNIDRLAAIERERDIRSSWNIVPRQYPYTEEKLEELAADGFEIGVHGLYHDGRLFSSRQTFDDRLPELNEAFRKMNSIGFRSPATHRNAEWMSGLECRYDSSFPDTDPFEPQAGGSLSLFPFFLNGLLELPYTLPQDHTLFEILGESSIDIWTRKIDWIARCGGMALAIIHPDYMTSEKRLDCVRRLLDHILERADVWVATPRDVCRWWHARNNARWDESGAIRPYEAHDIPWAIPRARAVLEQQRLTVEAPGGPLEAAFE
ncbi:MAG: hypothetical protein JSV33_02590 [bacterium]|nr:MAG: hypothetical protein JSV33_02590 [bacterium]